MKTDIDIYKNWLYFPDKKVLVNINHIERITVFDTYDEYHIDIYMDNDENDKTLRYEDKLIRDKVFELLVKSLMED